MVQVDEVTEAVSINVIFIHERFSRAKQAPTHKTDQLHTLNLVMDGLGVIDA
jgi:hypothetical protein